jgi:hypothetical protein
LSLFSEDSTKDLVVPPSVPRNHTEHQKLFDYHADMTIPLEDNIFAQQVQEFGVVFGSG